MRGRIIRREAAAGGDNRLPWPRLGALKCGIKNEKGLPRSVDYFVASGKYAPLFAKAYGPRPDTVHIVFPDDDAAKVCSEFYEYRNDKGELIASGDGAVFQVWDGSKYVTISEETVSNVMEAVKKRYPVRSQGAGWSVRLTMAFILPLVKGVAGVWTFSTKGAASSIPNIRDSFDAVKAENGFCKGIIFDMSVRFATSQHPGSASRFPVVEIVPNHSAGNIEIIKNTNSPLKLLAEP